MIVVSLDEGGRFEFQYGSVNSHCMFVGGAVFFCKSAQDVQHELGRLKEFFEKVCEEQHAVFPEDLHYNHRKDGQVINAETASCVKQALFTELPDFLKNRGRWSVGAANGSYGLYAMVSDSRGMGQGESAVKNNLLDDNVAANRYEHMAYRTLENLLFYNHKTTNEKTFQLELATRVLPVGNNKALASDTRMLGYRKRRAPDGGIDPDTVIVTDEGSYRAFLESAAESAGCLDAQFNINVQTINYDAPQNKQGFLYLADTICSLFQDLMRTSRDAGTGLKKLYDYCGKTVGTQKTMLWAYHPIDRLLRRALIAEKAGNCFEALLAVCKSKEFQRELNTVYETQWFASVGRRISAAHNSAELQMALEKLNAYMRQPGYSLKYSQQILKTLKTAVEQLKSMSQRGPLLFRLLVIEMTIQNHMGNHEKATQIYDQCIREAHNTTIEEFLGLQNMISVTLLDSMETGKALKIAQSTVTYHEMLNQIRKEICESPDPAIPSYGRALSQLGQCQAFSGSYDDAICTFKAALRHFREEPGDRMRTISYLLHAAIEADNKEIFETYADAYFGQKDISEGWKKNKALPDENSKFGLYVFMKAIYVLYREQLSRKEILALTNAVRKRYTSKADGHPWELILKYCALLVLFVSDSPEQAEWWDAEIPNAVDHPKEGILPRILMEAHEQIDAARNGRYELLDCHLPFMYR